MTYTRHSSRYVNIAGKAPDEALGARYFRRPKRSCVSVQAAWRPGNRPIEPFWQVCPESEWCTLRATCDASARRARVIALARIGRDQPNPRPLR